jgi:hypothetical protein
MKNPADQERAFWESAAVAALGAILATEVQVTCEDAAGMAAIAADHLLGAWVVRFTKEEEP